MNCSLSSRWIPVVVLLLGFALVPASVSSAGIAPCQEQDPATDEADAGIVEKLAELNKLVESGKVPKALTEVRKLYRESGHLRAGYALSQLIAQRCETLAKSNRKKAHELFVEGGELARELLANPEFPDAVREEVRNSIYNQACSEAVMDDAEAAQKSLGDLFAMGFEDFSQIENDRDFAKLLKEETFRAFIAEARQAVVERVLRQAREEIAAFESFPFDFTTTDVVERPLSLTALKGKIVIVDFWGTWCPPCRAEIPAFIKLKELYASDIEIIGLAYERGEPEEAVTKVVEYGQKAGINYPCAIGDEATQDMVPEFRGYPTTLFIDRDGKVRMLTVGAESYERLESIVLALMEQETSTPATVK
jgi:thiol-disulfide isomerase/thioredoxin